MSAGRSTRRGWRKDALDLGKAGEMLREFAAASNGDPIEAALFRDVRGRHRRISARYSDGWSLQLNFSLDGKVSSYSMQCSLRGVVRK